MYLKTLVTRISVWRCLDALPSSSNDFKASIFQVLDPLPYALWCIKCLRLLGIVLSIVIPWISLHFRCYFQGEWRWSYITYHDLEVIIMNTCLRDGTSTQMLRCAWRVCHGTYSKVRWVLAGLSQIKQNCMACIKTEWKWCMVCRKVKGSVAVEVLRSSTKIHQYLLQRVKQPGK